MRYLLAIIALTLLTSCTMPTATDTNIGTSATTQTTTDTRPTPPGLPPSGSGGGPRDQGIGGYTLTAEQKATCGITVQTTEGPYYVQNTPQLADNRTLNYDNLSGKPITLTGHVYSGTGSTPISGAKIEIWEADDSGKYHPNGNANYETYASGVVSLRGYVMTNAKGEYTISTIYPGLYEGRARHIHFRISADEHNPVITQLILPYEGDTPTPENDNVSQGLPTCQIIYGDKVATSANLGFDFRLKAE